MKSRAVVMRVSKTVQAAAHVLSSESRFLSNGWGEEAKALPFPLDSERSRQSRFLKFPVWVPSSAPAHCRTHRFLCLSGLQPLQPRPSVSPTVHALAEPLVACYYPNGASVDSPPTTGVRVLDLSRYTDSDLSIFRPAYPFEQANLYSTCYQDRSQA